MSLTDKVIKNTYYFFISQVVGFILPVFLTPFILYKIGNQEFAIYALVLGFTGIFGLFDMSLSSAFIKFISEHFNKNEPDELNYTVNTGMFFYIIFSLIFCGAGFIFSEKFLSLFNIPPELKTLSITAFRISLVIFFISNSFGIFNSVLVSLQKMYITSILGIATNILNLILIILILLGGYGLLGILVVLLFISSINTLFSFIYTKKEVPSLKISLSGFKVSSLKKMMKIGIPMQIAKLSTFANEKYDEFLLASLSILNNVTLFNVANRVTRYARLFPMQLYQQGAPVAAELNAKEEKEKLILLLRNATKYMALVTSPIFIYIFVFPDILITAWLGNGYEISMHILRILAFGQLINMTFSAPGNSILPNIGIPKFQMHEGLICLGLNIPLSYLLIKYYGIIGAAYGSVISITISSIYLYFRSVGFFNQKSLTFFKKIIAMPNIVSIICAAVIYTGYKLISSAAYPVMGRKSAIIYLVVSGILFFISYTFIMIKSRYLDERDKEVFTKLLHRVLPLKRFQKEYNG